MPADASSSSTARTSRCRSISLVASSRAARPKSRDSDAVYYGYIKRGLPAVVTVTVEINHRIYSGNFEETFANATFSTMWRFHPKLELKH